MSTPEETLAIGKWAASIGNKPHAQKARLRWVEDLEPLDDFGMDPETFKEMSQEAERWGVWGIIVERQCSCCGSWTEVDALWSIIGQDEAHEADMRAEAERIASAEGIALDWT